MSDEATGMLIRGLLADGAARLLMVDASALAQRTIERHGLNADGGRLAAQAIVAVALASAHIKGDEALVLQIQGEQPAVAVYADLTAGGALRARLTPADLHLPDDRVAGMLLMIKHAGGRELYRGVTEISGEPLEEALANHLGRSEQVDALLGIDVHLRADGSVLRAAGYLVERLPSDPDAPSLSLAAFEERYGWLRDADRAEVVRSLAFGGLGEDRVQVLEQRELVWQCRCTIGRIEAMLVALGPDEIRVMADEDHGAEVTCHFCNRRWKLSEARLRELAESIAQA
ncbi:MAG: Hsp33 family molecular chaperone HslO [Alphaproteobacteria bacterium]|nr:Hsp33 family molecular chaperone HslO [Alphaproteobacteria bacterium]MCB9696431.1 Hsp33 family molecular chaperone HslO [Alphaproteobacteria bacterium]